MLPGILSSIFFDPQTFLFFLDKELACAERYNHFVSILLFKPAELAGSRQGSTLDPLARALASNVRKSDWVGTISEGTLAAIIHKFGVSVDFLRKFRAESVFRCDYKASKLVEPNRDEARAPSGNSSARRGLYICVGAGSQGNVRWDTDGASVMRRAFVRDKTMPGAPRCDEKFPEPGHRF